MDRATLYEAACDFVRHSPLNCVPIDKALAPDVVGMRMYDVPLMAVARADDALFASYRAPEAIGPHYRLPADWLPQDRASSRSSSHLPGACARPTERTSARRAWSGCTRASMASSFSTPCSRTWPNGCRRQGLRASRRR